MGNASHRDGSSTPVLIGLVFALLVLYATGVQAATIQGEVYTFDLESANGVIVEVDTVPHQKVVVRNGSYSLNVPSGSYTLTATQRQKGEAIAETSENVTVSAEGTYTVDLILFPIFNETDYSIDAEVPPAAVDDSMLANETAANATETGEPQMLLVSAAIILAIIILTIWLVTREKRKAKASANKGSSVNPAISDTQALIDALRKNNGRLTQKDLRRMFPHSEAKVSLMLTELEHKGVIEKIRKGRSNVIILKQ